MYDILFMCNHCGVHLSADEDDVGIALPCPNCEQQISVPSGDVLFDCPECGKALLASADSRLQHFHCPYCEVEIVVPPEGKRITIAQHPPEQPAEDPLKPPPPKAGTVVHHTANAPDTRQHDRFMTTWGDYLAAAGLTDDDAPKTKDSEPET